MAETFNIELEADLSEFTSTVTDGGDLSWSAGAALAGTSGGLSCLIDDTNVIYGLKTFVQLATAVYRYRFYVDPNSLSMSNSDGFFVARVFDPTTSGRSRVELGYSGGNYTIRAVVRNDSYGEHNTSAYTIADEPHYVEVRVVYATGAVANDGTLDLWIDGVHKEQITGVDLFNLSEIDRARLGPSYGIDASTSGAFYLDEFVLRDDGTEIGAVGGATPPTPPAPGGTSPWWDGTWGIPAGSTGVDAYFVAQRTSSYRRGRQYWVTSLQFPKAAGTSTLTYREWCAQLQANGCNLIRVHCSGDNHPSGGKAFSFEPPPYGTFNCWHNVLDPSNLATYRSDQGTGTWGGNWSGSNLERLIDACGSYGVKMIIGFGHSAEFRNHWTYHAYNSANRYLNGVLCEAQDQGMVASAWQSFSNSTAIAAYQARCSEVISTVGSTNVVAGWELMTELNNMCEPAFFGQASWGSATRNSIRTILSPWVTTMVAHIGSADPQARPILTGRIRIPPTGIWSSDKDNFWNVVNEPIVAAGTAVTMVGVNSYNDGDYDKALLGFRMAQEYVGTSSYQLVYMSEFEGSDNGHPPNAYEVSPYRPSKAIQWIGAVGEKWGLGSHRWHGFTESAPNVWTSGCAGDPGLSDVAGVTATFASYVDWNAHRVSWEQRHGDCSSTGLDSIVASGNAEYVTLFARWTGDGSKTLSITGMTNGAYTFHIFNWLTGASVSEQDVVVTTGAAAISLTVSQSENRLAGYLVPKTTTGSTTLGRALRIVVDATTSASIPDAAVVTALDETTRYELRARAADGSEVARLGIGDPSPDGHHIGPLQYIKHVNSPGGLTLRLSGGHPLLDQLEENGQVEIWRNAGAGWYRDFTAIWTDDYDYEYRGELSYTGYAPGKLVILDWATVAWAAGEEDRSRFSDVEAETAAKTLAQYNVASDATETNGRDLDWTGPFTITVESDLGRGEALNVSCPRQPLLEILQEIAISGGGDFDLMRSASDPLEYQFRWYHGQRGTDRTATVRFSVELANMKNVAYRHRGSHATTAAIVGGRGEGTGREIEPRSGNEDGVTRHREAFVNATEVALGDTDALRIKGDRYLTDNADTEVFSFEVAQTQSSKYGVHYCASGVMGDLVTVVRPNDGQEQTHKIIEVTVAVRSDGGDSITVGLEQV